MFDWPGRGRTPADVEVGGDYPFVRRIVGVTVCNLVGSVYNEGIWVGGMWTGMVKKRTAEGNRVDHAAGHPHSGSGRSVGEPMP